MESCIVAAGSPDPWNSGARHAALGGRPMRLPKIAPAAEPAPPPTRGETPRGEPLRGEPPRIEAMQLSCYNAYLRGNEANLRKRRLPCLKCSKRFWTTRFHRICVSCQVLNDLGL